VANRHQLSQKTPPGFINDPDFLFRRPIKFINQLVDLPIRRVDLSLEGDLLLAGYFRRKLLV
jgi:hypothetical protein